MYYETSPSQVVLAVKGKKKDVQFPPDLLMFLKSTMQQNPNYFVYIKFVTHGLIYQLQTALNYLELSNALLELFGADESHLS